MLPIMLMLMGGLFSFAMILWTDLVVASTLQSALRTCVAKQSSLAGGVQAQLQACAQSEFDYQFREMRGLCDSAPVTRPNAQIRPGGAASSQPPTYLLAAEVTCQKKYLPFMSFYNLHLLTATIRAKSAMPFTP